jgi:hypothetical protein
VALTFAARTIILDKVGIVCDGQSEPLRDDPERLAKRIAARVFYRSPGAVKNFSP